MSMRVHTGLAAALLGCFLFGRIARSQADDTRRVACVGDSITYGSGTTNRRVNSYPAQLGKLLGTSWQVGNFGVGGATLLNRGDKPYQKQKAMNAALAFHPQAVVIMLGTNDTKPQNWKYVKEFPDDYRQLIDRFAALPEKPTIFLCIPPPVPKQGNYGINEAGIEAEKPLIRRIAADAHVEVIDMYTPLKDSPQLLPDNVHPNNQGAAVMARTVFHTLTGKTADAGT